MMLMFYGVGGWWVLVKYFSPMTNVCIIRVAREQHKVAWGAVTLLSMVDRQRVVPNVVHVSGASLLAALARTCVLTWVQARYDTRSWRLSSTTGRSWRGTGRWPRPQVDSSRIWRRARRRLRRCGTESWDELVTCLQCTLRMASSPFSSTPLGMALVAALASRDARSIRRQLPSPNAASLADFTSNDYLSLASSPLLRSHFLHRLSDAAHILGSGGSRLLVNGHAHAQLETRLKNFFGSEEALLFNSGFDANTAFFECVPQPGDVVVYDEHVHASVHDGLRASRIGPGDRLRFRHNDVADLRRVLGGVRERPRVCGSVFVAVESVYSMDGTVLPLREVCDAVEGANGYLVVDEAHATGLYGPQGKGRVAMAGLEHRVLARLCTFGKALGASGGESDSPLRLRERC